MSLIACDFVVLATMITKLHDYFERMKCRTMPKG